MKLGVIGNGIVGSATARSFLEHCEEIRIFDTMPQRRTYSLEDVLESNLIFVCLPTPQKPMDLHPDLSAIDGFFDRVAGRDARALGVRRVRRPPLLQRGAGHRGHGKEARCSLRTPGKRASTS